MDDESDRWMGAYALAQERTQLARERTILAHIRTGFSSFLFGAATVGLVDHPLAGALGGAFVLVGLFFLVTGMVSYVRSDHRVGHLLSEIEQIGQR